MTKTKKTHKGRRYRTVSVPEELSQPIESNLTQLGYRSLTEFVIDTTRRRLEDLLKTGTVAKAKPAEALAQ